MRAGVRRGRGCVPVRAGLLLALLICSPLVLALQLLLVGPRLPRAQRAAGDGVEEREGAVAFSVISIEPERSSRLRGAHSKEEEEEEKGEGEERSDGARAYEDENEITSRQVGPRAFEVQPWAAGEPSFKAELSRIITYITRPQSRTLGKGELENFGMALWVDIAQACTPSGRPDWRKVSCSKVLRPGQAQASRPPAAAPQWLLCAEDWLLPAADTPCVAYSFSMDGGDADFLKTVSGLGCEIHSFDPSNSNASGGHLGNSLVSNHGERGVVTQHKMWLEWRAPRKRKHRTRGALGSVSQTLADIMAALGHHTVHFLYADLLSAEWRVFQNWIELGTLEHVHHLVAMVHLQWAGFEVGGTNEEVVRFWFSVLQGLQDSGLKLVHNSAGDGHSVLKQTVGNARSSYTLSWVNTRH